LPIYNVKSVAAKAHLIGMGVLASDIEECLRFLREKEYKVEHFYVSEHSTEGLIFAHPLQLAKLQRFGWLTLIDSTHKTNKHDWRLFTLYIRDSCGCWDVGILRTCEDHANFSGVSFHSKMPKSYYLCLLA
jgi:hypothetical protein